MEWDGKNCKRRCQSRIVIMLFKFDKIKDFTVIKSMISHGEGIAPRRRHHIVGFQIHTESAAGVFTVDDGKINIEFLFQQGQIIFKDFPSGAPHNITDK